MTETQIDIGGKFDRGHYGVPQGNVPTGYWFEFASPEVPNPLDPDQHKWQPPETQVPSRSDIPEYEWGDFFSPGIDTTWKVFADNKSIWFDLYTLIDLLPGTYRFVIEINADLIDHYNEDGQKIFAPDPNSGLLSFICGKSNLPGSPFTTLKPFGKPQEREYLFSHNGGPARVGIDIKLSHPLDNNGIFTWNWRLYKLDDSPTPEPECRGLPRVQYQRRYNVYPVDASEERQQQIAKIATQSGESVGPSYDDAGLGDLDNKQAVLWDLPSSRHQEFIDWYDEHYPGTTVTFNGSFAELTGWERYLCWQADDPWKDRLFGNGWKTPMWKHGCVIAVLASIRHLFDLDVLSWPDANETLDLLPDPAFKPGTAEYIWASSEKYLGFRTWDVSASDIPVWLAAGNVALARVDPPGESKTHYILVVEKFGDSFLALDPWLNKVIVVKDHYPDGIDRWLKADILVYAPPPPTPSPPPAPTGKRNRFSFHVQSGQDGWDRDIIRLAEAQPAGSTLMVKFVQNFERATLMKSIVPSGNINSLLRKHVDDQHTFIGRQENGYNPHAPKPYDPYRAAEEYMYRFWPKDEVPNWLPDAWAVQSLNEVIGTGNEPLMRTAVQFDVAFSNIIAARAYKHSLPVKACLLNIAVGNPGHNEVPQLMPVFAAAHANGHLIGYNGYGPFNPTHGMGWIGDYEREARHHWMRSLLSWDPVARASGLKVEHVITEHGLIGAHPKEDPDNPGGYRPGAYTSAASGWRDVSCANGDFLVTKWALLTMNADYSGWDVAHNGRLAGTCYFTVDRAKRWGNFLFNKEQRAELVTALIEQF